MRNNLKLFLAGAFIGTCIALLHLTNIPGLVD